MRSKRRRLLTGALEADPAQRALELGHLGSDALEVVAPGRIPGAVLDENDRLAPPIEREDPWTA